MKPQMEEENGQVESKPSQENCTLSQAINSISSLISLSYHVKVFAAKWQLIRNKIEELNSGLLSAENCDSGDTSALSELIPAIILTVNECSDLAHRCVDLTYSGKLLMQSDLEVILTKFDFHVKNLSGIYTAGLLTHRYALVVSKPGFGASKDDMRFYMRDLLTRIKVGDFDMKKQGLSNLYEVVAEDEKYVRILVEVDEFIGLLVNFLDSQETEFQELSAKIASLISGFESYKGILIGAGIIGPLVRVLEGESKAVKEAAARCLQKLTENSDNAWSVSAHGGVTALLKICSGGDCKGELIGCSCSVLKNIVRVVEIKRFLVEEGAISTFINLARSKDEVAIVNSVELLQTMVFEDESLRQAGIRGGAIPVLVRLLDPKSSFSFKTRETAFRAIDKLCFSSLSSVNVLLSYGFMDQILHFFRYGELSVQELALKAAHKLCRTSEEARRSMGDSGFMPELVKLLDAKSMEVREMAAQALCSIVSVPKNRKRFVQDDRNISKLLQVLDPDQGLSGDQKILLSILMSLTDCNSGRMKIANSGYLKNVEKLAEAGGSDARRLVRKLSMNRFRRILKGIWR